LAGSDRSGATASSQPTVLITDQDAAARSVVVSVLGADYRCEQAGEVAEAREKLARTPFELALCDANIRGESGWILAEEILVEHPHTSVVFVTAEDDLLQAQQAFELGAHGYLVKPYSEGQLLITAMNALKRRELEIAQGQHEQALQQQLQTVIDNAPLRIYVKDREHRFIAINHAASAAAGLAPEELIGRTVEDFMAPESAEISRAGDNQVLLNGDVFEGEETLRIDGETRTLLTSKFPLLNDAGDIYAVCGISADVTAIQQAVDLREELVEAQRRAIAEFRASRQETVERLARTVELHDPETGGHIHRMARISALLGRVLGLDQAYLDLLLVAAPMHDVGKIGIPAEIMLKPGPLTPEERKEMERHTTLGYELLADSDSLLLETAARIALTHHERWDGTGYPEGLAGEEIPLDGRIVAVADVFDALLSDRPYRPAMSLGEALEIIREGKGTHFDPAVVDVMLEHLDEAVLLRR
jgi:PAS domain S-box-containing protein